MTARAVPQSLGLGQEHIQKWVQIDRIPLFGSPEGICLERGVVHLCVQGGDAYECVLEFYSSYDGTGI